MLYFKNTIPKEYESILEEGYFPNINFDEEFDVLGIKGDNLQGLISLLSLYKNKIRLAYADVPYNTGGQDFLYNDKFNDRESLNFHSNWISWMLPRLIVVRELLSDNGVMVISIDHNERKNLENLCEEVFGSKNVFSLVTVVSNRGGGGRRNTKDFVTTNEYLIVCSKNIDEYKSGAGVLNDSKTQDKKPRSVVAYNAKLVYNRPTQFYPFLVNKLTKEITTISKEEYKELKTYVCQICEPYRNKQNKKKYDEELHFEIEKYIKKIYEKYEETHKVIFPIYDGKWGRWVPSFESILSKVTPFDVLFENSNGVINYWEEVKDFRPMKTILDHNNYSNTYATNILKELYGEKNFSTPKSPILMRDIITQFTDNNDIVLDWCAGSNSTYHGLVLADKLQNVERNYIFIQQEENNIDLFEEHSIRRIESVNSIENLEKNISVSNVELIDSENFYLNVETIFDKDKFIQSVESVNSIYKYKTHKFEKIYQIL